ncbi:MAG: hypothetical protein WD490_03495 [Opitutales bacterium]
MRAQLITFLAGTLCLASASARDTDFHGPNRVSFNTRFMFNVRAEFTGMGDFPVRTHPGAALDGIDHFYDDGFNRVDSSGNAGGDTWFWGYDHGAQVQNDALLMSTSHVPPGATSRKAASDPHLGFEMAYAREIHSQRGFRWGMEGAFGYTDIAIRDGRGLQGDVVRVTDAFALEGTIPPAPPYSGTFEGPGPLLADLPVRSVQVVPGAAEITGRRNLDAHLFGVRVGPYIEVALFAPLSLQLGAGLALAYIDSEFTFIETTTVAGAGSATRAGSSSGSGFRGGGYVDAKVAVALTPRWSLFGGAQYQRLGRFSQEAEARRVQLDLGDSVSVTLGAAVSF